MRNISKDPKRAICCVDCKSEYTHRYFNCWGISVKSWLTSYTDPGTGKTMRFWGKITAPGVRIMGHVPVYLNPIN